MRAQLYTLQRYCICAYCIYASVQQYRMQSFSHQSPMEEGMAAGCPTKRLTTTTNVCVCARARSHCMQTPARKSKPPSQHEPRLCFRHFFRWRHAVTKEIRVSAVLTACWLLHTLVSKWWWNAMRESYAIDVRRSRIEFKDELGWIFRMDSAMREVINKMVCPWAKRLSASVGLRLFCGTWCITDCGRCQGAGECAWFTECVINKRTVFTTMVHIGDVNNICNIHQALF